MSSSNRVKLSIIEETDYNVLPVAGDFYEVRYTSESFSGTPQTVESQEIRADRQTFGQVNTGLELSGGFEFELSADPALQTVIKHAMMDSVGVPETAGVADLTIDATNKIITTTGDLVAAGLMNGDFLILTGFTNPENNTVVIASNVLANSFEYISDDVLIDEASLTAEVKRPAYYQIGTDKLSMTVCKEFADISNPAIRSITYTGERVGEMTLNFAFGEIVTGSFSMAGAGYDVPAIPVTDSRNVIAPSSKQSLDSSNAFGWMLVNDQDIDICIESLSITLNNNLLAQNCIGLLAPQDQVAGSAAVTFEASMHLGPNSFDQFMPIKLNQQPVSLSFYTRDVNGEGYGITLHRVQFNFPDPQSGGRDQQVLLETSGTASYDSSEGNTMRFYFLK